MIIYRINPDFAGLCRWMNDLSCIYRICPLLKIIKPFLKFIRPVYENIERKFYESNQTLRNPSLESLIDPEWE